SIRPRMEVLFRVGERGSCVAKCPRSTRAHSYRPSQLSNLTSCSGLQLSRRRRSDRIARRWWQNPPVAERIHHNSENVSVDLFVRLDGLTKARRGQFIAIALAGQTCEREGHHGGGRAHRPILARGKYS